MNQTSDSMFALGRLLAQSEDERAPKTDAAVAEARRRFLGGAPPSRGGRRKVAAIGAFALAAAVLVVALLVRRTPSVSFVVGDPPAAGSRGDFVSAEAEPLALHFSEGSEIVLGVGTRLRITDTTARGAEIHLEHGALDVRIAHEAGPVSWSFRAGPFWVLVVGTAFELQWDGAANRLEVATREGTVRVRGPHLGDGHDVAAGERLVVASASGEVEIRDAGAPASSATSTAPADATESDPPAPSAASSASDEPTPSSAPSNDPASSARAGAASATAPSASTSASATSAPAWRDLMTQGHHRAAMAALDDAAYAELLTGASGGELMSVADAARLGGRPDRAYQALLRARERGARGDTAFLLGKIAADQLASGGQAIGWFETYLAEQPRGALAEQALGRVLELSRRGPAGAAVSAAQRYLAAYPNGAYAALARSVLEP